MSIESITAEYQQSALRESYSSFSEIASSFETLLMEEGENLSQLQPNPMPQPVEDTGEDNGSSIVTMPYPVEDAGGEEGAAIVPLSQSVEGTGGESAAAEESSTLEALTALMAMSEGGDWTYDREALVSEVDTFLTALGVDHHDIKELTDMFPPEGAELDLVRMGKLVTKAGDILAGRVDAEALTGLMSGTGMTENEVQSWLTNLGVEYQRTGELMQADGEAGEEFNSTLVEDNLLANIVNTLPEKLTVSDLSGLIAGTVGQNALFSSLEALLGDLAEA